METRNREISSLTGHFRSEPSLIRKNYLTNRHAS